MTDDERDILDKDLAKVFSELIIREWEATIRWARFMQEHRGNKVTYDGGTCIKCPISYEEDK